MENFMRKEKTLNLEPERSFMGILGCSLKNYCDISNQPPLHFTDGKISCKMKNFRLWAKNAVSVYFFNGI